MENQDLAREIYCEYQNSVRFKSSEKLEEKCRRNERFFSGDQWRGVVSSGLPLIVYNFLKQIVLAKVSIVSSNALVINYSADDTSAGDEEVEKAGKILSSEAKRNWKRLRMNYENQVMLINAAITGIGATYWYWDDTIEQGNKVKTKGEICFEHIDVSEIHFSNPRECDLQRQDFVIISKRKSVKKAKSIAKAYGASQDIINSIESDQDDLNNYFDKQENASYDENNVTILYKFTKKDGRIYQTISTPEFILKEEEATELSLYPIAMMNWDVRKRFIYGEAEISYLIPNQIAVNKLASLRHANALLFGSPKILIDSTRISNFSNQVGGVLSINGSVKDAYEYIQPQAMGIDVDKSINENISLSKETSSVNDNLLGASRPENTSAIMLQQKQSSIPLDMTKMRFYDYLEQVGKIQREFIINYYDFERFAKTDDESGEMTAYTGTDFKDISLETTVDVGASTQWSEVISVSALDKLMERKDISVIQGLERYPNNIIPDQKKLVDELKATQKSLMNQQQQPMQGQIPVQQEVQPQVEQQQPMEQSEFTVDEMFEFVKSLPIDIQRSISSLGEDERLEMIESAMKMNPDELKTVFDQIRS